MPHAVAAHGHPTVQDTTPILHRNLNIPSVPSGPELAHEQTPADAANYLHGHKPVGRRIGEAPPRHVSNSFVHAIDVGLESRAPAMIHSASRQGWQEIPRTTSVIGHSCKGINLTCRSDRVDDQLAEVNNQLETIRVAVERITWEADRARCQSHTMP